VVIEWLKEASFSAVARRFRLTWDEVDGIMARAVDRGLALRARCAAEGALCRGFLMVPCIVSSVPKSVSQETVQRTKGNQGR